MKKLSHKKIVELVSGLIIVIAMILVSFFLGTQLYQLGRWDPLGEFPIQIVQEPEINGEFLELETEALVSENFATTPAFYWDQEITNTGVKCVKEEEGIVDIRGTLSWVSDEPPGRIIKVGEGSNTRGPGCQQYSFSNPIPDEVREQMEVLKSNGVHASVWHITGTETPFRRVGDETEEGDSRTWKTTTFTVIHKDTP